DRAAAGRDSPRLRRAVVGSRGAVDRRAEFLVGALGRNRLARVAVPPLQREGGVVGRRVGGLQVVGLGIRDGGIGEQCAQRAFKLGIRHAQSNRFQELR